MSIFYVFQGKTYEQEKDGEYIWTPKLTKDGKQNPDYEIMTEIQPGDFILHDKNGEVVAISLARTKRNFEDQSDEYKKNLDYCEFEIPFKTTNYQDFFARSFNEDSAFDKKGEGKKQYLCHLSDIHADFIITQIARTETDIDAKNLLNLALASITFPLDENEYDKSEIEGILRLLENRPEKDKPEWKFKRKPTDFLVKDGYLYRKLDLQAAADALAKAEYKCEVDSSHNTTISNISKKNYTEAYHLVPLNRWYNFGPSLDVMENIVSLCPLCHNVLLYGKGEKFGILKNLWDKRKNILKKCGIELSEEEFFAYYGAAYTVTV